MLSTDANSLPLTPLSSNTAQVHPSFGEGEGEAPAIHKTKCKGGLHPTTLPQTSVGDRQTAELPLVSVVIPIYNGEALLPTLLSSLAALDYPPDRLEILLVDNNSSDRTPEILAATPYTVIHESQPGCGTARNAGIRQAQGEFIACTDADCVVDPSWIKDLLAGFTDNTIGAVAGTIEPYELNHPVERYEALQLNDPGHRAVHVFLPTACTANVMYRAEVFRRVGLLLNRSGCEETDLNWRMQTQTEYRIHFLESGGRIRHRYRADVNAFCRSQRYKARTLVDLHHHWGLHVPTGRKELLRMGLAIARFPLTLAQQAVRPGSHGASPQQRLYQGIWQAWLDILVPWTRYCGIREGRRLSLRSTNPQFLESQPSQSSF